MTPWYACLAFLTFPLPACLFELGSRVLEEDPLCQWNTNMRDVKLMDDCDILKDNLTLKDPVGSIADRFECISEIELKIAGREMRMWKNKGLPFMGDVSFENPLKDRKHRVNVTVTAIPYHAQETFTSKFTLDPTNCSAETVTMKSTFINASSAHAETEPSWEGCVGPDICVG